MYLPYLRGQQFELLALRELSINGLIGELIIPIIEPVKLSPTLFKTISIFKKNKHSLALIGNPLVGTISNDNPRIPEFLDAIYGPLSLYNDFTIIKALIMNKDISYFLNHFENKGVNISDLLIVNDNPDYLNLYLNNFKNPPKYVLIRDEGTFRRKVSTHRILFDDKFKRKERNADYNNDPDEFFSDDHLYYKEDGYQGFADYSIIGNKFLDAGFAPYAVAIHIIYKADNNDLRIRHFVSDSNDDISDPAHKFFEALSKLNEWAKDLNDFNNTLGLQTFIDHYNRQTYPGLGTIKKLSLMHHFELIYKYLHGII